MPTAPYGHCEYGVDYSTPPHELPPNALVDAQNVIPNQEGLITGVSGATKINSTAYNSGAVITSVFEFRSGTTRKILCSSGTKVGIYNAATGVFDDHITGLTTGKMFQWVNFAGKALGVNGADAPQYSDGTTGGDLNDSPPVGVSITEWAQRAWIGGDTTNVATLTGSALNDPTDWSTAGDAGFIAQTIGDSKDPIVGLIGFFDMLLVGKANALYKVIGDPPTTSSELEVHPIYSKEADSVGFTSKWAVTQVGNDIIFLDGFDIKRLSGIQEYGDVETSSIIPHFKDYIASIAHKDYIQYSQFFHYKQGQRIWVTIPTSSTAYYVFVLDYRFKPATKRYAFFPMSGFTVNCFGGVEDGSVVNIYYGDRTGYVHQLELGNDINGAAVDRFFVKFFAGNDAEQKIFNGHDFRKQFYYSDTLIRSEETALTMTPYYARNLFDGEQIRDSDNYTSLGAKVVTGWSGTGTSTKKLRFGVNGLDGRTLSLKWRHNTVGQNFVFAPSNVYFDFKSNIIVE